MSECIHCVLPTPGVVSAEKLPTDNKSPQQLRIFQRMSQYKLHRAPDLPFTLWFFWGVAETLTHCKTPHFPSGVQRLPLACGVKLRNKTRLELVKALDTMIQHFASPFNSVFFFFLIFSPSDLWNLSLSFKKRMLRFSCIMGITVGILVFSYLLTFSHWEPFALFTCQFHTCFFPINIHTCFYIRIY